MAKQKGVFEKLEAEVISETEDFIKGKFKKNMLKLGEVSIAFLTGFLLVIIGLVELLAVYYPNLAGGFNYLLIGVLFLIVGLLLKV